MRATTTTLLHFALACSISSCVGDASTFDAEEDVSSAAAELNTRAMLERVVIARMYQGSRWVVPEADRLPGFPDRKTRRIAYVCQALVPLQPTYVSGLVRLGYDTPITPEMREIYEGVKSCVRHFVRGHAVRFDVVLNTKHYTAPPHALLAEDHPHPEEGVRTARQGNDRVRARLRSANQLDPDVFFFDFYTVPFNARKGWFEEPMRTAIRWVHDRNALIAGNVWGRSVPRGTDFAAVPIEGEYSDHTAQIRALRASVPTLVHIRNDPHLPSTAGRRWFRWSQQQKRQWLGRMARGQRTHRVGFMYNVLFPLSRTGTSRPQRAYDAKADGRMLEHMAGLMNRYAYRPR